MTRLSEHFSKKEFACKHCGKITNIDPVLIAKLECLRAANGNKPIFVTSGYRCPVHNKNVGGAVNSQHMKGKAVDIYVKENMAELIKLADRIFAQGGMGVYKNFIHLDTSKKRRWKG